MSINLRDLTKEFFAGTLDGESDSKRALLNEGCGCGSAPDSSPDLPQFIDVDPIGNGIMGSSSGAASHDSSADVALISALDQEASAIGGSPVTAVVSALSNLMNSGQADPSQMRQIWDTLFNIAQSGAGHDH
jgi:hypothetical protein